MPQFSLPNIGPSGGAQTITAPSLAAAEQQAQAAGTWAPSAGTFGAGSTLGAAPSPGPGPGPGAGDLSGLAAFGAQTSGVTQAQLAQQKAEFDAQLQYARDRMQQLDIPQLQINQMLAQMQQQQFQAQLALAAQQQQYTQQASNAQLTGWLYPTAPVPNVSQFTGPLSNQGGGTSWNQLSNYMQQQAGGNYNDQAAKTAFAQAIGTTPNNLSGQVGQTLSQAQLAQIMAVGGVPQSAIAGAVSPNGMTGGGLGQGAMVQPGQQGGAPNPNLPQQTLAGQSQQAVLSGMYQGAPTEAAREFNQNLALQQGQLGQQYLATAAQLQGPQNTFQLQNYLQGAQGNPNVPVYLQNLASNTKTPGFQQAGTTVPTVQSAQGLGSQMAGGQSATPGWNLGQTQNTLRGLMGNAQGLAPGSIESLNPDQLAALGSGLGSVGGTLPSFLQQYANSRIGQQAPVAQARLA